MKYLFKAALAVTLILGLATPAPAGGPKIGKPAPSFALTTHKNQKVTLESLKGKVIVINLWATWCVPCRTEMPMFSAINAKLKDHGLEMFGVTTEDSVPINRLMNLADRLSYPLTRRFIGNGYPVLEGVPTTYIIDRKGVLRYAKAAALDGKEFVDLVLPLLKEQA